MIAAFSLDQLVANRLRELKGQLPVNRSRDIEHGPTVGTQQLLCGKRGRVVVAEYTALLTGPAGGDFWGSAPIL